MIHCPKCREMIGDSSKKCPMCGTVFTQCDLGIIEKERTENEKALAESKERAFELFLKKKKSFAIVLLTVLAFMLVVPWVALAFTSNAVIVLGSMIFFCILEVFVIVWGSYTGGAICPHCGASLFRNNGRYCAYCGGRISR